MAKYISAVEAAEKAATALKIPLAALVDVFAEIPAADVAPVVHGHWFKDNDSFHTDDDYYCFYFDHICSECGEIVNDRYKLPNYCPNCGARMDGETEENNG